METVADGQVVKPLESADTHPVRVETGVRVSAAVAGSFFSLVPGYGILGAILAGGSELFGMGAGKIAEACAEVDLRRLVRWGQQTDQRLSEDDAQADPVALSEFIRHTAPVVGAAEGEWIPRLLTELVVNLARLETEDLTYAQAAEARASLAGLTPLEAMVFGLLAPGLYERESVRSDFLVPDSSDLGQLSIPLLRLALDGLMRKSLIQGSNLASNHRLVHGSEKGAWLAGWIRFNPVSKPARSSTDPE